MPAPPAGSIAPRSCSPSASPPSGSGHARSRPRGPATSRRRNRWPGRAWRCIPRTASCATTSRCCTSWRGNCPRPRRWRVRRCTTSRRCRNSPRTSAISPTAPRATRRRGRSTSARSSCLPSSVMTSTSSSATLPTNETSVGERAVAPRARAQSQARARQGESGYVEHVFVSKAPPERAFEALTEKISRERGVSCGSYKDKCLKRRIAVRMRARGVHTYEDYGALLDRDAHEYQELLDALTINVTKFFRNVETWNALRPYLDALARARPRLRVWSAGCSSGEEPYTIAVLLAEVGVPGVIDATDVDRLSLERTRQARYPETAFSEMPAT